MTVNYPINVYEPQRDFIQWLDTAKRSAIDGSDNAKTTLDAFIEFKAEYYRQAKKEKLRIVLLALANLLGAIAAPIIAIALIVFAMTKDFMGDYIFVPIIILIILGIAGFISMGKNFLVCVYKIYTVVLSKKWMWTALGELLQANVVNQLTADFAGMSYFCDTFYGDDGHANVFHYNKSTDTSYVSIVEYPADTIITLRTPSLSFANEVVVCNKRERMDEGYSTNIIQNIDHPAFAAKFNVYCDSVKDAFSTLSLDRMDFLSNNILGVNKVIFDKDTIKIVIKKHFDKINLDKLVYQNATTDAETFTKIIQENANKLIEFSNTFFAVTKE